MRWCCGASRMGCERGIFLQFNSKFCEYRQKGPYQMACCPWSRPSRRGRLAKPKLCRPSGQRTSRPCLGARAARSWACRSSAHARRAWRGERAARLCEGGREGAGRAGGRGSDAGGGKRERESRVSSGVDAETAVVDGGIRRACCHVSDWRACLLNVHVRSIET